MTVEDWQVPLWDAINRYVVACGGDPSKRVYGNTPRQTAVAEVNGVVRTESRPRCPCGRRVEEGRECFATPMCHACLPPPAALPVAGHCYRFAFGCGLRQFDGECACACAACLRVKSRSLPKRVPPSTGKENER